MRDLDDLRGRRKTTPGGDAETEARRKLIEHAPAAFVVTRGAQHHIVAANDAFREAAPHDALVDRPLAEVTDAPELHRLLEDVYGDARAVRDIPIQLGPAAWQCSVWPMLSERGAAEGLTVELRSLDQDTSLLRTVAERILLGALRDLDLSERTAAALVHSRFVGDTAKQLSESLDEQATREAIRGMHLLNEGSWCIVDVIERNGELHRLAIIHPDPEKKRIARALEGRWTPRPGEPFGIAAMQRRAEPVAITADLAAALAATADNESVLADLHELGIESMLTVPMTVLGDLVGAITFVGRSPIPAYSPDRIRLAEELAFHAATALDNARLYTESLESRAAVERASRAKSEFLGHMSHELRTPLNAIAGYVELIERGIHGPVNDAQLADLRRIRVSQQHVLVMINDILSFMQVGSGKLAYHLADTNVAGVMNDAITMTAPLAENAQVDVDGIRCEPTILVRADRDRLLQILVNLLTNAVKFTPAGGRVTLECQVRGDTVLLCVEDTGIGIPEERQQSIFEPFVQIRGRSGAKPVGVGLGLAISRELARAMNGDLTVTSKEGSGSRFVLTLPLGEAAAV